MHGHKFPNFLSFFQLGKDEDLQFVFTNMPKIPTFRVKIEVRSMRGNEHIIFLALAKLNLCNVYCHCFLVLQTVQTESSTAEAPTAGILLDMSI